MNTLLKECTGIAKQTCTYKEFCEAFKENRSLRCIVIKNNTHYMANITEYTHINNKYYFYEIDNLINFIVNKYQQ